MWVMHVLLRESLGFLISQAVAMPACRRAYVLLRQRLPARGLAGCWPEQETH